MSSLATSSLDSVTFQIVPDDLPEPFETPSTANPAQVVPVPDTSVLQVPDGFSINVFAENLNRPRWLALTPTGDVLVTETPDSQIRLLRDTNGDGTADDRSIFANADNGLDRPFGMAFSEDAFFLGNEGDVRRYAYQSGDAQLSGTGQVLATLPTGGHWTRNVALSPDGTQLYVSVGSASNVTPEAEPRASVQVMDVNGGSMQTFASGLRNPVGLDFHPVTGQLYTTVNERDGFGDDLVPDFFTGLSAGEFYGWPYAYFTPDRTDPRIGDVPADLVAQTQTPDVLFQAHSAPLGLQFYDGDRFPEDYQNGAFVAFRGSWNRSVPTGYKVVFVPFDEAGNAQGSYRDFVTGFLDVGAETTWGRPTGLLVNGDGSLLFTEESNGRIYRVGYDRPEDRSPIWGSEADETLTGTAEAEAIAGLDGIDRVLAGASNDAVFGNGGTDELYGEDGNDSLFGGRDNDVLSGGDLSDRLSGDEGNDWLYGGSRLDVLDGGSGNDSLFGGRDADTLIGGEGIDRLQGDLGDDLMWGGVGGDGFVVSLTGGFDRVFDFELGIDRLLLEAGLTFDRLQFSDDPGGAILSVNGTPLVQLLGIEASQLNAQSFD
ncbi:MAG: PQQ-dependent sugar dehydrogenase [Cyanobacteria bacterium SID2]|nr:PQQ-dependent sugar dehydrogenase [Cyanobacteria bacterium SID2]MBP0005554.1 PQQ-dependent sugar dehydrogenase [Cyanobacteria bacterium SBC]